MLVMKTGVIILRTIYYLGGGFKYVLSSPLLAEMIQFSNLTQYFSDGLKPPTRLRYVYYPFGENHFQ